MGAALKLGEFYDDPLAAVRERKDSSRFVAITSNTVPWEILSAAGSFPLVLRLAAISNIQSTKYMEDVFDTRIREIFDYIASAAQPQPGSIVIPRTSEQEHKLFLYFREFFRLHPGTKFPAIFLYNLLHSRSADSANLGLVSTRELLKFAEKVGGQSATRERLEEEIRASNLCRHALRKLMHLRQTQPGKISGTESMRLIGPFYFLPRKTYATLLGEALADVERSPIRPGPRILIKGSSLPHTKLHEAIEQHNAVVVAEDDWWGSRSAMPDIPIDSDDPIEAIFQSYYSQQQSPRVYPSTEADKWFLSSLSCVDAIIFYLPPDDDVYGWDYPRLRNELDNLNIPHFVIREDAERGLSDSAHHDLELYLSTLSRRSDA